MSALADAIIFESEKEIIDFIKTGIDVNEIDQYGLKPIIQAVICDKKNIVQVLLAHGADIDQRDFLNRTALHWAADRGNIDFCKLLLDKGASPDTFSFEGQPILVNPILREQLPIVELFLKYNANYRFAQDFISAKLIGHRFELLGETDIINAKEEFIPLSFEGFYLEFTSNLIKRSLHNFINSISGNKYHPYADKIKTLINALRNAGKLSELAQYKDKSQFMQQIDLILQQELLLVPVGYKGHATAYIIYKNMLAICNRGVTNRIDTVVIYHIKNKQALTLDLLKHLLYEPKTEEFMDQIIFEDLGLTPITSLATTHQVTGNCSWANIEASVPAMLIMLSENLKTITANKLSALKKDILAFYKDWIDWDKDVALDELIFDLHQAHPARRLSKAMILSAILTQRCDPKFARDVKRATKILSILIQDEFRFILLNCIRVQKYESDNPFSKRLDKLFVKCKFDKTTIHLLDNKTNVNLDLGAKDEDVIRMTTSLHIAALENNLNLVKYLVENLKMDVNYTDRTGSTAIMYAAWKGNLDIVKYLLEHGASSDVKNMKGGYAIAYARHAKHKDIVNILSKKN